MLSRAAAILLPILFLAACASDSSKRDPAPATIGSPLPGARPAAEAPASPRLPSRVHFDFDRSSIDAAGARILEPWADRLAKQPALRVALEGHCDERGTVDYNVGLGERRARAVRDFLLSRGARPDQLTVVSYGEERPLETGHRESAWRMNRRVDIVPR